jgi:uncharacterized protein
MLYRTAPRINDQLSSLGFGCMRLPTTKEGRIDEERATSQLRHAIDAGVNYVDTAWPYHGGQSEPFVGRALANGYREKVKVATKLPSWLLKTADDMDRYLDAQLQKLNTLKIDYYLVHALSGSTWDRVLALGITTFLDRAKADGRIVNAGFSFHGARPEFKPAVDGYPWEFCQIQYNYIDEELQAGTEGLNYAASKGLAIIVMEPLRGGLLAANPQPAEVQALLNTAGTRRTPADWALRWVLNHPEATVTLSGMNDEAQVEENLAIASEAHPNCLTAAEVELLTKAARKYRKIMKAPCTGCGYCQPCPSGVEIPGVFGAMNMHFTFGKPAEAGFLYALQTGGIMSGKPGYASLCSSCQDCLDKCPQELPIPDLLEEAVAVFEGPDLARNEAMIRQVFAN